MSENSRWSVEDVKTLYSNHGLASIKSAYSPEEITEMYIAVTGEEPSYFMNTSDILNKIACSL